MLLNSPENWSIKLVVLESLNKLLYMLFFVSFGNFSPFYIACLYTSIHVLYILPVICKNFNTYGLRIPHWMLILYLISRFYFFSFIKVVTGMCLWAWSWWFEVLVWRKGCFTALLGSFFFFFKHFGIHFSLNIHLNPDALTSAFTYIHFSSCKGTENDIQ